jgi:hypothetical protein
VTVDEKPWWRRWDGVPATSKVDLFFHRHPIVYGTAFGIVMTGVWTGIFMLINDQSFAQALALALGMGALWGVTQAWSMTRRAAGQHAVPT